MKRTVVITGASTGIGRECALRMAERGWDVFGGVRNDADGAALTDAHASITPLRLDVVSEEERAAAVETVAEALGDRGLDGLVNNAGIVVGGPLELMPLDAFRNQFEVNVFGLLGVTQVFLPLLHRAKGRVVQMGSSSGRVAAPMMGAYAASKFALEGLSDALRMELSSFGVAVSLVQPGAIATPIWDKSKARAEALFEDAPEADRARYEPLIEAVRKHVEKVPGIAAPASKVADAVEHALTARKPRTRYVVGVDARVQGLAATLLPDRLRDRIISRFLGH